MKRYRKKATATVLAVQMTNPFVVETLEGPMAGKAGDYLVTSDDGGESWPVAQERFLATYDEVLNSDDNEYVTDEDLIDILKAQVSKAKGSL